MFLANKNLSYGNPITYSIIVSLLLQSVMMGDVNNDHQVDIVVTTATYTIMAVSLGYKNGIFSNPSIYSPLFDSNTNIDALGDFNNDGKLDIIKSNSGESGITVYFGSGNGTFGNDEVMNNINNGGKATGIAVHCQIENAYTHP